MPSATLTWQNSGLGAKTGTTTVAFFTDLAALVNSKSADANFAWQVAASSLAATPYYVNLKRKDGSPGRILVIQWTIAPGANNPVLLETTPSTSMVFAAFFPNGNVDTPSNLTTAGVVMGNDAGCTKVVCGDSFSSIYSAGIQHFYFENSEMIYFGQQNPAATACYGFALGNLAVDADDNVYPAALGLGSTSSHFEAWGAYGGSFPFMAWSASLIPAGSSSQQIRLVIGGVSKAYYIGMMPTGAWASQAVGGGDVLTDTANSKAWFVPLPLLGLTKGEGFIYKLRQVAWGPGTVGAFSSYYTSGPVLQARQFNARSSGGNGYPWMVNFKI